MPRHQDPADSSLDELVAFAENLAPVATVKRPAAAKAPPPVVQDTAAAEKPVAGPRPSGLPHYKIGEGERGSDKIRNQAEFEKQNVALANLFPAPPTSAIKKVQVGLAGSVAQMLKAPALAYKMLMRVDPPERGLEILKGLGVSQETLDRAGPMLRDAFQAATWLGKQQARGLKWAGDELQRIADEEEDPRFADQSVGSQVLRAGGTALPYMLGGGATSLAGKSLTIGMMGGAQNAVSLYEQVLAETGDEDKAMVGALVGFGIGQSEIIGVGGALAKLNRATGGSILHAFGLIATESLEEAGQELFQTVANGVAAGLLSEREIDALELLSQGWKAAGIGAILGGALEAGRHGVIRGNKLSQPDLPGSQGELTPEDETYFATKEAMEAPIGVGEAVPFMDYRGEPTARPQEEAEGLSFPADRAEARRKAQEEAGGIKLPVAPQPPAPEGEQAQAQEEAAQRLVAGEDLPLEELTPEVVRRAAEIQRLKEGSLPATGPATGAEASAPVESAPDQPPGAEGGGFALPEDYGNRQRAAWDGVWDEAARLGWTPRTKFEGKPQKYPFGHESQYVVFEPPDGSRADSIQVRVSSHDQVPGGGYRITEYGGERAGEADLSINVAKDMVSARDAARLFGEAAKEAERRGIALTDEIQRLKEGSPPATGPATGAEASAPVESAPDQPPGISGVAGGVSPAESGEAVAGTPRAITKEAPATPTAPNPFVGAVVKKTGKYSSRPWQIVSATGEVLPGLTWTVTNRGSEWEASTEFKLKRGADLALHSARNQWQPPQAEKRETFPEQIRRLKGERASWVKQIEDEVAARGGAEVKLPDGRSTLISRDAGGKWRVTHLGADGVPSGHEMATSIEDAAVQAREKGATIQKAPATTTPHIAKAKPDITRAFTADNIQEIFGVPQDQARAIDALARALALDPNRIRLVKGGRPGKGALHQRVPGRWYYSNIVSALERWQPKGTPAQLVAHLAKTKGAGEEAGWIRLEEFLRGRDRVTRDEVLAYVEKREVYVRDVEHGAPTLKEFAAKEASTRPVEEAKQAYGKAWGKLRLAWVEAGMLDADDEHRESRSFIQEGPTRERALKAGLDKEIEALRLADEVWKNAQRRAQDADDAFPPRARSRYSDYQQPEGDNYRELLLTLSPPPKRDLTQTWEPMVPWNPPDQWRSKESPDWEIHHDEDGLFQVVYRDEVTADYSSFDEAAQAVEEWIGRPAKGIDAAKAYAGPHWDEPNVIAHIRLNDRVDRQGNKTLFIEEIQSDWHQSGKRRGYQIDLAAKKAALHDEFTALSEQRISDVPFTAEQAARYSAIHDEFDALGETERYGVPDAPFKGHSWPRLALKRILAYAAEQGYDAIAWTTGKMQADRYQLSQQVDKIDWREGNEKDGVTVDIMTHAGRTLTLEVAPDGAISGSQHARGQQFVGAPLADILGKEVAKTIMAMRRGGGLQGDGLDIGGKGMHAFYDRELRSVANELAKPLGIKVDSAALAFQVTGEYTTKRVHVHDPSSAFPLDVYLLLDRSDNVVSEHADWLLASREADRLNSIWTEVPALMLSQRTREQIKAEGFPLFQANKGAVEFTEGGDAIVRAMAAADVSTGVHEIAHIARRFLLDRAVPVSQRAGVTDHDIAVAETWAGAEDGRWSVEAEEKFARGFERYLLDGKAPNIGLRELFERFSKWLREIYRRLIGSPIDVDVSPAMREVFDRLMQRGAPPTTRPRPTTVLLGRETEIELADGRTIPARYAIMEAEELVPSHDARAGFRKNEGGDLNERPYDDPTEGRASRETVEKIAKNPKVSILGSDSPTPTDGPPIVTSGGVVLGGNARSMAVQLAYHRGHPMLRGDMIRRAIEFGVDELKSTVANKYRHPVVVRIVTEGHEGAPGELSRALNQALTTAKTNTTEAVSRGSHVTPQAAIEIAGVLDDGTLRDALGDAGKAKLILRALVQSGAFSDADLTALVLPSGLPTQAGKQVIEDALLGAIVNDVRVLAEAPPSARNTILRGLPSLIRIKATLPRIAQSVTHAVQGAAELKASRQPLADALRQQVLPGVDEAWKTDAVAVGILRSMESDTPTETARKLARVAQAIEDDAAGQGNLFEAGRKEPMERLLDEFAVQQPQPTTADPAEVGMDIEDGEDDGTGVVADPGDIATQAQAGPQPDPFWGGATPYVPIGGRLYGTLQNDVGEGVSAPAIIAQLARIVEAAGANTPIRWGRLGRMKARGVFKVQPEVIRVRTANNITTAAHEVAHALEKAVFGWDNGGPWKNPLVASPLQQELVALGKALYGDRKPAGGYKREGWAEYLRLYITQPAQAKQQAPLFTRWFEGEFSTRFPKIRAEIDKAQKMVREWGTQGSLERARASMVDQGSWGANWKKMRESATLTAFKRAWVESGVHLHQLSTQAEREMGHTLQPKDDPFQLYSFARLTHSARVRRMVSSGMVDLWGNQVGPALVEIRPLISGRYDDFRLYLWARRARALWNDPVKGPRNPGLSKADADKIIEELGSPKFELAAGKVYEWNAGVLNYAAQASPSFARVVQTIREVDPGDYVPLQREFDALDELWAQKKAKAGVYSGGGIVSALKGSGRRVKDPLQAMLSNAERTLLAAHKRMVLEAVIKLSRLEGMGTLVEEVPVDQVPAAKATVEQALRAIKKAAGPAGRDIEASVGLAATDAGLDIDEFLGETLTFFAPAQFPKGQDPVLPVYDPATKKVRWYRIDHGLASTLAGLDVARLPKLLDLALGVPARTFRAGTTGLRASFGLITNPLRDIATLAMNTRSSAWAPQLWGTYISEMTKLAISASTGGRYKSAYAEAYLNLGGAMAMPLGQDSRETARAARELAQSKGWFYFDPRNWLDFYKDLVQIPELGARATELRLVAADVGWRPGDPMSPNQAIQLLNAAAQVTTDFRAAGNLARVMNQVVPFTNATLQGTRAVVRAQAHHPGRFYFRGLQMAMATLALWWQVKDDEWYKELKDEHKFAYWHIPFWWNGKREIVMIPRAHEIGGIFAALPEMLADAWYRQDPKAAGAWFDRMLTNLNPLGVGPVIGEAAEQLANRDFYWGTPIVPTGEQRRPKGEQFNEYTSRAAIKIGQIFGVSPRSVDHAIRGVLGGVGSDVVAVVGLGPKDLGRETELSDMVVLGRLFKRGGDLGTQPKSVELVYDALAEAQALQASTQHAETKQERLRRLMLSDAAEAMSALSYVRSQTKGLSARRELTREIVEIAQDAMRDAKAEWVDRRKATTALHKARRRKEALAP